MSRKTASLFFLALLASLPVVAATPRHRAVKPPLISTPTPGQHSFAEGGYADRTSVLQGGTINFYISNKRKPFTVTVVNMSDPNIPLTTFQVADASGQPDCTGKWQGGCGWSPTQPFVIPGSWPSGYYAVRFDTTVGTKFIPFIVRSANPASVSPIVVVQPTNTYEAYNVYGGKNVYPTGSPDRSTQVSFDRPYDDQDGLGNFRLWEEPFLTWMHNESRKFEAGSDTDLEDPTFLSRYKLLVIVGHAEYWTLTARQNIEQFSRNGGHIAMLSGNNMWFQARLDNNGRQLTVYKDPTIDPLLNSNRNVVTTNYYAWPVYNPENLILGASYRNGGYSNKVDDPNVFETKPLNQRIGFTVRDASSWVFAGTNLKQGDMFGAGAAGLEVDGALFNCDATNPLNTVTDGSDGTPLNFHILGTTPGSLGHGTVGMYTNAAGGTVFNAATRDWAQALLFDPVVAQMTRNVFDRLSTGQAQLYDPVTTTMLTQETFNCPQDSPEKFPGWRGDRNDAAITSSCAYEGPGGMQLKGAGGVQLARNFAPTNVPRNTVEVRAYVNADNYTGAANTPFTLIGLQNFLPDKPAIQRYLAVELNVTTAGVKQVRLVLQTATNTAEARSDWTNLASGWNQLQVSFQSPGTLALQVGSQTPVTLNNTHTDYGVSEVVVTFPRDPTLGAGSVCIDAIAAATAKIPAAMELR